MQTVSVYDLRAYTPDEVASAIVARAPARVDFFGVMMTARHATTRAADVAAQYHRTIAARTMAYPSRIAATLKARMVCGNCGAVGCKMWREYQTFADHTKILCALCAMVDQNKIPGARGAVHGTKATEIIGEIDADGRIMTDIGKCDQIGWFVPAVPIDDTFWGYTSVPAEGVAWWRALPTYRLAPNMSKRPVGP